MASVELGAIPAGYPGNAGRIQRDGIQSIDVYVIQIDGRQPVDGEKMGNVFVAIIVFAIALVSASCSQTVNPGDYVTQRSTIVLFVRQDDRRDEVEEFAPGSGGFQAMVDWLSSHASGWQPNYGSFYDSQLHHLSHDQIMVKIMLRDNAEHGFIVVGFFGREGQYRQFIQKFRFAEMAPLKPVYVKLLDRRAAANAFRVSCQNT